MGNLEAIESCGCGGASRPRVALVESDNAVNLYGCPPEGCATTELSPRVLRVERIVPGAKGSEVAYTIEDEQEMPLPSGWGESTPMCLPWVKLVKDPARFRACMEASKTIGPIKNPSDAYRVVKGTLEREEQECFYVLSLDTHLRVRAMTELTRGSRASVAVPTDDVLRLVLVAGATAFVVAHNHPSGKVKHSKADKELTESLAQAGHLIGVPLLDHLVVSTDGYYSFEEDGKLSF